MIPIRDVARSAKNLALVGLLIVAPAAAQNRTPPRERFPAELDRYLAQVLAEWQIPGLAIAVVRNDSVLVARGYGVRELGRPGSVDANTVFDAASLTKAFTATAAAILVDRGRVRWDDPVQRHLPDLILPTEELTRQATLRDFLSHRTGLESANMMWVLTAADRREVVFRVRHFRVLAPLRERMIYNNVGYTVAGEALAAAAGTTFDDVLRDVLIKPLRLRSTTATYEHAARMPNVASPHATIGGRQQPIRRETQRHAIAAAGAVQSSANDLARWMRLHLNDGVLDGARYVSEAGIRELQTIQVPIETTPAMRAARLVQDSAVGYGLGWQIMDYRGHPLRWHTGNGDGQVAFMALLPRDRLGVVVLVNTWSAPFVHAALMNRILDTYLGYEPRDWAGEALARVPPMQRAQDSAARAMVAMKSTTPPPFPLSAYAARYEHPLFGPIWIRLEPSGLTLQMGEGQTADLEYHGAAGFFVRWRDPLFRENFGTHVQFGAAGNAITGFSTRINRDEFTTTRVGRPDETTLVLDGLTVISMTRSDSQAPGPTSILIRGERIANLYPTGSRASPAGARRLDLTGRFAIPGLVDAHVHLTGPFGRSSQQDSLARFLLLGGVTAVRDMAGDGIVLEERARAARSGATQSPRLFYSTMVGSPEHFATDRRAPSIAHGGQVGRLAWMRGLARESDARDAATGAKEIGATGLKAYAGLTPALLTAAAREAHARGLKVWSHASVGPAKPSDGVAARVDVLSPASYLAPELLDSLPGSYQRLLDLLTYGRPADSPPLLRLFAEMHRRGTMLDPTLFVSRA